MRSAVFFTAAFAAAVMASPIDKRDEVIVTATDIAYTTDIITVTAGQAAPTQPAAIQPAAVPSSSSKAGWFHKHHHGHKSSSAAPAPAPAPSSSAAPAPAPAPSSYSAPAPAPTSAPAPAPAPSSSAAPAPASSAGPAAPIGTGVSSLDPAYQAVVVAHHNVHRANYSSPDLAWDSNLAAIAQQIADTCVYGHSMDVGGGGYGQNIAAGNNASAIGSIISDQFYNGEVNAYNQAINNVHGTTPNMDTFDQWGHMSQIVWAASTKVGCATSQNCGTLKGLDADYGGYFTVCNYSPAGNVEGEYVSNIGACKEEATVPGSANLS